MRKAKMRFPTIIWAFAVHVLTAKSASNDTTPKPLVIPASQYFDGNDGPWSSFFLRVGTPEQPVRVLVSTASPESMVALAEYACSTAVFPTPPADCAVSRGVLFKPNESETWVPAGRYNINENGVGLEANLGYSQIADFALDRLALGLNGPTLDNQTVAGIGTASPFYLGIFGLNNQPVNYSTLGNYTAPSFIQTLKDQNKIPSISWSYTAGAKYRLKTVYGQLIFSGYDTSRFTENPVSFSMAEDITRDLVVGLQSITYSGETSTTLLSNPIDIYIDSTDPNLWLPPDVCDAFEKAFGLTLDEKSGLYLVNDTHREALHRTNAQVSFRLSDVKSGGDTVSITLPYSAFDLNASFPLVDKPSGYFPLKRANSSTQYTLGRTFLQEAYLSADYERKVFNVSACVWNQGADPNIVTITSKDSDSDPGSDPGSNGGGSSSSGSSGSKLGAGAIAGIVIGAVVGAILVAVAIAAFILRKRRKWMSAGFRNTAKTPEPDESVLKGPVFNSGTQSSATHSSPFSAADMSAPTRSTAEYSRSGATNSPARPATIDESVGGASTVELDGQDTLIRPDTELDGRELHPVYELPGSTIAGGQTTEAERPDRAPSTVGALSSERGSTSPPSPYVSTMGTNWGAGERPDSELVSPTTPARHSRGPRAF